MTKEYIFNISFQRNATSSFHEFMTLLNYNSFHNAMQILDHLGFNNYSEPIDKINDLNTFYDQDNVNIFIKLHKDKLFDFIDNNTFDVYSDNPLPIFYKELDKKYKCKFILFIRNPDEWLKSMIKYFNNEITCFRKILYDGHYNDTYCKNKYIQHNKEVINYFKDKKNLLIIDLNNDNFIEKKIFDFLNIENIENIIRFPILNTS